MWGLLEMCEELPSAATLTPLWVSCKPSPPSVGLLKCVYCRLFNTTLKFLHVFNTVTVECPFLGVLRRTGCHFHHTCFAECGCNFLVSDIFKKSPGYIVISDACQWYTTDQSHCFIIGVNGWIDYCRIRCISKYYIITYACMFTVRSHMFVLEERLNIHGSVNILFLFFKFRRKCILSQNECVICVREIYVIDT